ncbi:hypothetical protein PR048_023306 [Dryococelus australis]|uniref:Uncharacterized protein n=1 Tax=Dryococelus australis TaxID=614101 RepID=A0ABQ9GTR1_9NEOP|nr:hypothetical protein PR048_023306 [Dryococelus australis]
MQDLVSEVLGLVDMLCLPCSEEYYIEIMFHNSKHNNGRFFMLVEHPKTSAQWLQLVTRVEITVRDCAEKNNIRVKQSGPVQSKEGVVNSKTLQDIQCFFFATWDMFVHNAQYV